MTSHYINGHHPSVLRSHAWRTASNSAAYLLPHLSDPSQSLLDVGCGPGTITLDFASLLPQGHVYGLDPSSEVISQATASATERGITNVTFIAGDVFDLAASLPPSEQFDVVHASQVLQHVPQPVEALRAMAAALKPGGIVAAREVDFATWAWWPLIPGLEEMRGLWQAVARADGCNANTGRQLVSIAMEAGFKREQITASAGTWCYSTPAETKWWGGLWAERLVKSGFATKAIKSGLATMEDLERYSEAWKQWRDAPDAWFATMHGEIICRVED